MILNEAQRDALTELINIAFARTAASLSELTGHRVFLDVPQVRIYQAKDLSNALAKFVPGDIASIQQNFDGPVSGNALLLLNYQGAVELTDLLTEGEVESTYLDESAREVLTEVGNILLNACLGMFGNLLDVHVTFSVPHLHLEKLDEVIKSLANADEGASHYALVVYTAFRVRESSVKGYLVLVLGVTSLDRLVKEVEKWEQRQTGIDTSSDQLS